MLAGSYHEPASKHQLLRPTEPPVRRQQDCRTEHADQGPVPRPDSLAPGSRRHWPPRQLLLFTALLLALLLLCTLVQVGRAVELRCSQRDISKGAARGLTLQRRRQGANGRQHAQLSTCLVRGRPPCPWALTLLRVSGHLSCLGVLPGHRIRGVARRRKAGRSCWPHQHTQQQVQCHLGRRAGSGPYKGTPGSESGSRRGPHPNARFLGNLCTCACTIERLNCRGAHLDEHHLRLLLLLLAALRLALLLAVRGRQHACRCRLTACSSSVWWAVSRPQEEEKDGREGAGARAASGGGRAQDCGLASGIAAQALVDVIVPQQAL